MFCVLFAIDAETWLVLPCPTVVTCQHFFFGTGRTGRAGVPMEVMGLMLGEFVDDYTVRVIDVFAMPQSGTVGVALALSPGFLSRRLP